MTGVRGDGIKTIVVALRPGVVVAYNRNEWTNARLRNGWHHMHVMEIDGSELEDVDAAVGHCMTCPVLRDPV